MLTIATRVLRGRIVVTDLNFHIALWGELWNNDSISSLPENGRVIASAKAIIECVQVRPSDNVR